MGSHFLSAPKNKPELVFIATRVPYPPISGHHIRTLNILRGLAENFCIHFFAFWDNRKTISERRLAEDILKGICISTHFETVGAERSAVRLALDVVTSLLTYRPFTAAKYHSRAMRRAVRETLATREVVLAHADSLQSAQYLDGIAQPKLFTNHNVEYQRILSYASRQRSVIFSFALKIQAFLTRRYERRVLLSVGNCVAVSEEDRKELARLAPGTRLFLVPNGADTSLPILSPADPGDFVALWVGGMNDPFNRDGVLRFASRVLPSIRARVPSFRWLLVGRDPPEALRKLASDPKSGVELAGFLPAIREAYARASIVVVPLLAGGGTKLKVLEAMAMGRAVVTTPVGAEGIHARDSVELEIAATDEEFIERVVRLFHDPVRRDRMAIAARRLVERQYSWEVVGRQMYDAVQKVRHNNRQDTLAAVCVQ